MVKIGILGLGTVGTGTVQILRDPVGRHHLLQSIEIQRVGVKSIDKPRAVDLPSELVTTDLDSIVSDPDIDIIVELMGGIEPARSLMLKAIAHGKHIVTANKAVIAKFGDEIFTAANQAGVYVMLEAAVGGGIPVIQPLKQSLGVNRIQRITGIINGTTNYILTRMTVEGGEFADILADAQKLGYAEADPTADVDGLDAGDKIAILASLAFGGRIKRDDVYCEGIRKISATDIAYADKLNFVIKLLAIAERVESGGVSVRVHPTFVPKDRPLATVNGVYNAILVEGEPLGQVMLFGPGAGAGATASAVVSDILAIVGVMQTNSSHEDAVNSPNTSLHPLLSCSHSHYSEMAPLSSLRSSFYVRFLCIDVPGVIGKLGTCFGEHHVSIESIVQTGFQGDRAEIVVVTHEVSEGDFESALAEIRGLDSIASIPSIVRVL
ncbi:homoserine dehydrogenase [Chamaesiphon minutus]|uniref:Homoserine dehydrogenase n=1 Tax=Chamaesiphon minutus (strain ATCC 27169 / PCC 6605) TaxID=1173020 RepID=K9UQN5_CHAP6|nr:homoserine dehydrogenase [Chamaesiphon minutus]AFY96554.1 homoserine dehydrogenase [Chamaesiphon minutus PCC 6605]